MERDLKPLETTIKQIMKKDDDCYCYNCNARYYTCNCRSDTNYLWSNPI